MIIISALILIYIVMMFVFWRSWQTIPVNAESLLVFPKVTVVVIARNEAANIIALLGSLAKQTYSHWELILVDDHSTDDTYRMAADFCMNISKRIIRMPDTCTGKKSGLTFGIAQAHGELILCTDADCEFNPDWITSMVACQQSRNARFVFGPVDILTNGTMFSRIQRMEFWGLMGSGAASLQLGIPSMCNGANLLFEKKAFNSVGGYAGIQRTATGDDVLLMMKLWERFPGSVVFCKNPKAIVSTQSQILMTDFVRQRSRWASKFNIYKGWGVKLIALVVFASYLAIVVAIPLTVYMRTDLSLFLGTMLVKLAVDYLFLRELQKFYRTHFDFPAYLLLQFIMPLYVTFFGILGRRKTFQWKGRTCA